MIVLQGLLLFVLLFVQFVVFMKLHHKYHSKGLHTLLGIIFTPQNVIVNTLVISVIGLELPHWKDREFVTTARMQRWRKLAQGKSVRSLSRRNRWRYQFSTWLCEKLNKHDAGHC